MARPYDARHPQDVAHGQGPLAVARRNRLQLDGLGGAAPELVDRHCAVGSLDHHAVAAPDRGGRRHQQQRSFLIERRQRAAGDLEGIGVAIVDGRKLDLLPAAPIREARFVEIAGLAGLRQAEQRQRVPDCGRAGRLHHLRECRDRCPGGGERLRDRFGRWPALAAIGSGPLGLVEGGRIEAGLLGEAGRRQAGGGSESVERHPDLGVGQHVRRPVYKPVPGSSRNFIQF